jgi:hypothetical protein
LHDFIPLLLDGHYTANFRTWNAKRDFVRLFLMKKFLMKSSTNSYLCTVLDSGFLSKFTGFTVSGLASRR